MLGNASLKTKLITLFLIIGIIPLLSLGIILYNIADSSLQNEAYNKLSAVRDIKKNQIEGFFEERLGDIKVLAKNPLVIEGIRAFEIAYEQEGTNSTLWITAENTYGPGLAYYQDVYGYYDLFLITPNGDIVYTVEKEPDFATNILTGKFNDQNIRTAFENGRSQPTLVDFEKYAPSNGVPAAFVSAPVYNDNERFLGVVVLQISLEAINQIMQERTGMGKTGETYLVGEDYLMRSDSRFSEESTVLKNEIKTKGAEAALSGQTGQAIFKDYRGISVVCAYTPLTIQGLNWVLLSEIDEEEAFAASATMLNMVFLIVFIIGLIVTIIGYFIAKSIASPITDISSAATNIAQGNIDLRISYTSGDEIGQLASSFRQLIDAQKQKVEAAQNIANGKVDKITLASQKDILGIAFNKEIETIEELMSETHKLIKAAQDGNLSVRGNTEQFSGGWASLVEGINKMLDAVIAPVNEAGKILQIMAHGDFRSNVTGNYAGDHEQIKKNVNLVAQSLNNAISQVTSSAEAVASASSQISSSSEQLAAGAQEQSAQVTQVAGAIEEMTSTIVETTQNTSNASQLSKNAGKIARQGGEVIEKMIHGMNRINDVVLHSAQTVRELGESSSQIGEIIQVIDEIADQTNLLALNAAIEAARAGEQGRGFAVVADEVRKLAERTTKATKEIASMINQIQKDTKLAVESMEEGTEEVTKGTDLAVQSQDSLTQIISSVDQVVDAINHVATASEEQSSTSEQISKSIEGVSSVVQQSAAGVQQIARAAEDLNRLTENLNELVGQFKITNTISNTDKYNENKKYEENLSEEIDLMDQQNT